MFETKPKVEADPEVIAYFDELFERHYPSKTAESAGGDTSRRRRDQRKNGQRKVFRLPESAQNCWN